MKLQDLKFKPESYWIKCWHAACDDWLDTIESDCLSKHFQRMTPDQQSELHDIAEAAHRQAKIYRVTAKGMPGNFELCHFQFEIFTSKVTLFSLKFKEFAVKCSTSH